MSISNELTVVAGRLIDCNYRLNIAMNKFQCALAELKAANEATAEDFKYTWTGVEAFEVDADGYTIIDDCCDVDNTQRKFRDG